MLGNLQLRKSSYMNEDIVIPEMANGETFKG